MRILWAEMLFALVVMAGLTSLTFANADALLHDAVLGLPFFVLLYAALFSPSILAGAAALATFDLRAPVRLALAAAYGLSISASAALLVGVRREEPGQLLTDLLYFLDELRLTAAVSLYVLGVVNLILVVSIFLTASRLSLPSPELRSAPN